MKDKVFMIVFIVLLGSILTTALVAVDNYTAPIIARNQVIKQKISILKVFEIPYKEDNIEDRFLENIAVRGEGEKSYYVAKDGTRAFVFEGVGLWGPIEGVIALKQDMQTISKIEIMNQEETPGLGDRITEPAFLDQFRAKIFAPDLKLMPEGQSQAKNEIDAITGATMLSVAFIDILNENYQLFRLKVED